MSAHYVQREPYTYLAPTARRSMRPISLDTLRALKTVVAQIVSEPETNEQLVARLRSYTRKGKGK